ncbi:MAG: LexA family protein [Chloroflexota bacterium]
MKVGQAAVLKKSYKFEAPTLGATVARGSSSRLTPQKNFDLGELSGSGSRFIVRACGESMIDKNIHDGDLLIVDSAEAPRDGSIVIAALNGEMTVKTYRRIGDTVYLFSANQKFLPIEIYPYWEFKIQGVVKQVIREV